MCIRDRIRSSTNVAATAKPLAALPERNIAMIAAANIGMKTAIDRRPLNPSIEPPIYRI